MHRFLIVTAAAAMLSGAATAANITYTSSRTVGDGSVDVSITTDGTIGTISDANIVDWAIIVHRNGFDADLIPGFSGHEVVGTGLTASATELLFDFSSSAALLFQAPFVGAGGGFWCIQGPIPCFDSAGPGEGLSTYSSSDFTRVARSGVQVIAVAESVAPVASPAGLSLLGLGAAALTVARRRSSPRA